MWGIHDCTTIMMGAEVFLQKGSGGLLDIFIIFFHITVASIIATGAAGRA